MPGTISAKARYTAERILYSGTPNSRHMRKVFALKKQLHYQIEFKTTGLFLYVIKNTTCL